ncbi:MAG: hypothetical protein KDB80_07335 [Planctomycetes bacterium]|nr:hypothetical protein [Planctomycetota bacterium]
MSNPSQPSRLHRGLVRTSVFLIATLASIGIAEVVARLVFPGTYQLSVRFMLPGGELAPIAESLHYLFHSRDLERTDRSTPRGLFPPDVHLRQAYDRPQWDYFDRDGAVAITTNGLGFRDDEFPVAKPSGELRILAVGDSFTYGLGVPLELTWPQRVERALDRADRPVQVINAGCPNTSPATLLEWFQSDGIAFEPDIVIVGLCLNDMSAEVPMLAYETPKIEHPWLGGCSLLLNHVQREIAQRALMVKKLDYGDKVREHPTEWQATQSALLEMRRVTEEHGARFGIVVQPMMSQLGELYPYVSLHEMVAEFCAAHTITTVDLLPTFRGRDERALWVHPTDQHPNAVGHELIARDVVTFLERVGFVE